ncbi:hypothetical protein MMC20_004543 [Loxospora ochrophaea]|nr:hypothetical protein [Loxospora ochrophaea]
MLIQEHSIDVPTHADGDGNMRIFIFHPTIPNYPQARFPGVVVFSEIYQGKINSPEKQNSTVTGPVSRFARQISGQGYIVAAPSSYHEFTGPEALAYDGPGTDAGNEYKIKKVGASNPKYGSPRVPFFERQNSLISILLTQKLSAYDEDASFAVSALLALPTCNGRVGATGMCLGGHLAFRAALDKRVAAAVCYFATDIHSHTLGAGDGDDSLERAGEIAGELVMIFGKNDGHVPPAGRDLIRKTLHEKGVLFSFYEIAWAQHAFIRDELSKGRYDPAISKVCFEMLLELFHRTLVLDLGTKTGGEMKVEDVC